MSAHSWRCLASLCLVACLYLFVPAFVTAGDWPTWRLDASRSAASPDVLPSELQLKWSRLLPRLKPAWLDQPKMQFDAAYEPIVLGKRLIVGSSLDDSVTAFDTQSGDEVWRYHTDGPVRFAPFGWRDKVYVASDDGYLHCLNAKNGTLVWRFRGGPSDRKVLGNERLISTWPVRGAPVISDGKIYFAAGIWPFMGIFLHSLDAQTGQVVWTNDGDGSIYMKQPHNSDSFAGVAPQGPLVAIGTKLLIPGGRSVPACYHRDTGRMLYYQLAENGKKGGGSSVMATDKLLFNGGAIFDIENEKYLGAVGELLTFTNKELYDYRDGSLFARDWTTARVQSFETIDRAGLKTTSSKWVMDELAKVEAPKLTSLIKAGSTLYAGSEGRVLALSLPLPPQGKPTIAWEASLPDSLDAKKNAVPTSLLVADEKLFVVTSDGQIQCFGAKSDAPAEPRRHENVAATSSRRSSDKASSSQEQTVAEWLSHKPAKSGYALGWGVHSGGTALELARQTSLRIVIIEPDAGRAREFRDRLRSYGLNDRVAVIVTSWNRVTLPPYFASFVFAESWPTTSDSDRNAFLTKSFAALRPLGGSAVLPKLASLPTVGMLPVVAGTADAASNATAGITSNSTTNSAQPAPQRLVGATWSQRGAWTWLHREGALPDSANWTHEHADAANTRVSKDKLVKAPLGLLWFGGSSNEPILPRHGHGPQPQVVDGRLIIEGVDLMRAMDIYTGRVLWETSLPGLGALYDNTSHQPGANASGTNYIATSDGVYVAYKTACLKLDLDSGATSTQFSLPTPTNSKTPPLWGYLNVDGPYLIGGAEPVFDPSRLKNSSKQKNQGGDDDDKKNVKKATDAAAALFVAEDDNYSSSSRLHVMDRATGRVLWTATARSGFRHNAICLGGGRMYCVDRVSGAEISRLKRRGEVSKFKPRLVVFDLKTGRELWSTEEEVFGTWLSYSAERDLLIEAGRTARDTLTDESKGMRTYRAASGKIVWFNKNYAGPAMIHHDTILMQGNACELRTGNPKMRKHPLTGELVEWTWSRNYGCNTPLASEHLLTFRSGAAGYFDFRTDGGTGNLGGFRSSCSNNLIVAGGVLCAPDYTRTCSCSYQNQTSIALVHQPDVETWTSFGSQSLKQPLRQVGINLGAPGDRKTSDGTLWLEVPSVGGLSPSVPVTLTPEKPEFFRRHSSQVTGGGALAFVAASGAKGLTALKLNLGNTDKQPHAYRVRLHFLEPDDVKPGERVFDVRLQGKSVLTNFDVVSAAKGRHRLVTKEFASVRVGEQLVIEFAPATTSKHRASVLSGVEVIADGW